MLFVIPVIVFHARESKLAWGARLATMASPFSLESLPPLACMMRARSITRTVVCDLDGGRNFYNLSLDNEGILGSFVRSFKAGENTKEAP